MPPDVEMDLFNCSTSLQEQLLYQDNALGCPTSSTLPSLPQDSSLYNMNSAIGGQVSNSSHPPQKKPKTTGKKDGTTTAQSTKPKTPRLKDGGVQKAKAPRKPRKPKATKPIPLAMEETDAQEIQSKEGLEEPKKKVDATNALKEPKARKPATTTRRKDQPKAKAQPQWKLTNTVSPHASHTGLSYQPTTDTPIIRPSIWSSSKDELVSALPELSKCINGVSWLLSSTPIMILDEDNVITVIDSAEDGKSVKLQMERDFVSAPSDTCTPREHPTDTALATTYAAPGPSTLVQQTGVFSTIEYTNSLSLPEPQDQRYRPTAHNFSNTFHNSPSMETPTFVTWPLVYPGNRSPEVEQVSYTMPYTPTQGQQNLTSCSCTRVNFRPGCPVCGITSGSRYFPPRHEIVPAVPVWNVNNLSGYSGVGMPRASGSREHIQRLPAGTLPSNDYPCRTTVLPTSFIPRSDYNIPISVPIGNGSRIPGAAEATVIPRTVPFTQQPLRTQTRPFPDNNVYASGEVPVSTISQIVRSSVEIPESTLLDPRTTPPSIPDALPPEIQAVIDAYVSGTPVVIIVSQSVLRRHWQIQVHDECKYAYLGFFVVERVWEESVTLPENSASNSGLVASRVKWRFQFRWGISHEELLIAQKAERSPKPWWNRGRSSSSPSNLSKCDDSDDDSTVRHRLARQSHPNHEHRLNPLHSRESDETFPPGWFCVDCGKLNYQTTLRHRWCTSSFCKDKPPAVGYALSLGQVRDLHQSGVMSHSYNEYPVAMVDASVGMWQDGMQTLTYTLKGKGKKIGPMVKHIFTGNTPSLQTDANILFRDFQMDVPLRRRVCDGSPYFSYTAGGLPAKTTGISWQDVPPCVTRAKDLLLHRGRCYGEIDLSMNYLSVIAWVTSGSRKGSPILSCTKHAIVLALLGSEATVTLTPKSGFQDQPPSASKTAAHPTLPTNEPTYAPDMTALFPMPMEDDDIEMADETLPKNERLSGDLLDTDDRMGPDATDDISIDVKPQTPVVKRPKCSITITMVHGDLVLLSGDNFEYSVKRSGTGMLLTGSYLENLAVGNR
ncbi:hypothetical protein Hypma_002236 [Hypsizygus marmoreus]|uniref:Uncharacterized protein n=1 Tax=Hypsizygus marmoreus TaxID=39966 RepID=A0A369K5I1_HYPMA|nr:hypothetical protein Hypma_002236 [Hypsizygus marmoreus]